MARASSLMIGTSTLVVIAVAFVGFLGFRKIHSIQQRGPLRIVFEGSASGLLKGGSVNFDGVQVGEVTSLKLESPRKIVALAMVENSAPIRKDTVVGLEFQGLTGVAAISLKGGDAAAPPAPLDADGVPTLKADLTVIESIRDTLHNVDHMLVNNESTIKDAMLNFETYTASLASQGDVIESALRAADSAIDGFDSTMAKIDNVIPGLANGKDGELFQEGEIDSRTGREFQQALGRLHGRRPPLAGGYQRGRQKSDPEIRRANQRCARTRPEKSKATAAVRVPPRGQSTHWLRARSHARSESASRCWGAAMAIMRRARSLSAHPRNSATPHSVTMASTSARGVVTVSTMATMRLPPFGSVAGSAMIARPPGAALAPRTKSSWPPMAPTAMPFSVSALTLPSRPTSSAELIATSRLIAGQDLVAVGVGRRPDRDRRVLMHKPIEPLGADQLVGDTDAGIDALAHIGHRTAFDEIHHRVVDDTGVNAEIANMRQRGQDRIRNFADAEL